MDWDELATVIQLDQKYTLSKEFFLPGDSYLEEGEGGQMLVVSTEGEREKVITLSYRLTKDRESGNLTLSGDLDINMERPRYKGDKVGRIKVQFKTKLESENGTQSF